MESDAWDQALGALLLFVANVTAILAIGVFILTAYRLRADRPCGRRTDGPGPWRLGSAPSAAISIVVTLIIIGVRLALSSVRYTDQETSWTTSAWPPSVGREGGLADRRLCRRAAPRRPSR